VTIGINTTNRFSGLNSEVRFDVGNGLDVELTCLAPGVGKAREIRRDCEDEARGEGVDRDERCLRD
jgi:hypothetical protein